MLDLKINLTTENIPLLILNQGYFSWKATLYIKQKISNKLNTEQSLKISFVITLTSETIRISEPLGISLQKQLFSICL